MIHPTPASNPQTEAERILEDREDAPPVPLEVEKLIEAFYAAAVNYDCFSHDLPPASALVVRALEKVVTTRAALLAAFSRLQSIYEQQANMVSQLVADGISREAQAPGADTGREQLAAAYVRSLLTIGDLTRFVTACNAMGTDRFGACHWCKRHLAAGHLENCEYMRAQKTIQDFEAATKSPPKEEPARPVKLRAMAKHSGGGSHLRLEVFENGEWNGCHAAYDTVKAFDETAYRINYFEPPATPMEGKP